MAKVNKNFAKIIKTSGASPDMLTRMVQKYLGVECVKEHRFHPVRKWRFDYAIPSEMIALEIEGGVWTGGRHISPKGFLGDMEKYNTAALMGWMVLRTTPEKIASFEALRMLETAILYRKSHITQQSPE